MIGAVEFLSVRSPEALDSQVQAPLRAILDNDGTWMCQDPVVLEFLNFFYSPSRDYSPSQGPFGILMLYLVGNLLQGKIVWPDDGKPVLPADQLGQRVF